MNVEFDRSFLKSLSKINNKVTLRNVKKKIFELENSNNLGSIKNIKKLIGYTNYYRIRIGNYRLGMILLNENTIRLIIIAHRKDIYRSFP